MNRDESALSESGRRRREAILADALAAVRRLKGRRTFLRAAAGAAVLVLIAVIVLKNQSPTPPAKPPRMGFVPPPTRQANAVLVHIIHPDDRAAEALTRPRPLLPIVTMNDDDFIARMTQAGHPVGLAYVNGRTLVLPN